MNETTNGIISNCYINLDIHKTESQEFVSMTQGDIGRKINIYFNENGVPFELSNVNKAILIGTKSDGTRLYNFCEIDNNTVVYSVTSQTTAVVGVVECQIQLIDESTNVILSPKFSIVVGSKTVSDKELQSTDEFNVMTDYIKMFDEKIKDFEKRLAAGEFKGAPFTYEDFTAEQIEALKVGAVNVVDDYNSESHQAQSGIAVASAIKSAKDDITIDISNTKDELQQSIERVSVDFSSNKIVYGTTEGWNFEKHPNGYIRISKVFICENNVVCNTLWNGMYFGGPIVLPDYPIIFDGEPNSDVRYLGSENEVTVFFTRDQLINKESSRQNRNPGQAFIYRPSTGDVIKKPRIGIVAEGWIKQETENV